MIPILSVITTTYNSSKYICDTIIAVLDQDVNFEFEYLISDDCSSDDTVKLVSNLKNSHPKGEYIRLLRNQNNLGVMKNFFKAVNQSRGKYIAFCDSDDLWIDKKKIFKQIGFLEKNKKCVMAYHSFVNKMHSSLDIEIFNKEEPINVILKNPQTSTMIVRGILRNLVNKSVVDEALSLNDQYLRFVLKDYGNFEFVKGIKPNIRLIREGSIFGGLKKLEKKRIALQSWKTFYKYHGFGSNKKYLLRRVNRFQSRVNWLEFKNDAKFDLFLKAVAHDFKFNIFFEKIFEKIKKQIFTFLRILFVKN